jgi:general secretion pathway protein B
MNEVEDLPVTSRPVENISSSEDVPRIDQLPAWVMNRLPSMAFSAHMYASIDSERWVRVNGVRMVEGNKIDEIIEIIRIEPQHVILNYSGQMFSMAALTDW